MDNLKAFKDLLRVNGENVTSPRVIIFQTLARKSPMTIVKLAALMEETGINRSTTYRNVQLLRRIGALRDVVAHGQRLVELSDDFGSHHHHFWCTKCGRLYDYDDPELDAAIEKMGEKLKVEVQTHQLELSGLCSSCLQEIASSK